MKAKVYNLAGKETGEMNLSEAVFGVKAKPEIVHEVFIALQNNQREPWADTKNRGEVRGGGKKPWQQKGTGRARHGSSRSPIWVGGGVAHGPRNDKNYSRKINKKAKIGALYSILSRKLKDNEIIFVDSINFEKPKTKEAKAIISNLSKVKGFETLSTKKHNTAIVALDKKSDFVYKSFNNFGNISVEEFRNINPVSILSHKYLVITNPEESLKIFKKD